MILQLNRMLPHNIYNRTELRYISSEKYPEQDERYIGKYINIRYTNHGHVAYGYHSRLLINKNKFPSFRCCGGDKDIKFKIVRFDKVEPNRVILINDFNEVIVADSNIVKEYLYYPGYVNNGEMVDLDYAPDWDTFNDKYIMEKIYYLGVQREEILGKVVFTEYLEDLMKYDSFTNILIPDLRQNTFEKIKEQLIMGNPKLEVMPDCILKSYPAYYNRHEHDLVDVPMRTINTGIVIRADINGDHFVIMEILQDDTKRYITESEGFFYYEEETKNINLKDYKKNNILEM